MTAGASAGDRPAPVRARWRVSVEYDVERRIGSQHAALAALTRRDEADSAITAMVGDLRRRRDAVSALLRAAGVDFIQPKGAFYVFIRVPSDASGADAGTAFARRLLEERDVAVVPGSAFGTPNGSAFLRRAVRRVLEGGAESGVAELITRAAFADGAKAARARIISPRRPRPLAATFGHPRSGRDIAVQVERARGRRRRDYRWTDTDILTLTFGRAPSAKACPGPRARAKALAHSTSRRPASPPSVPWAACTAVALTARAVEMRRRGPGGRQGGSRRRGQPT